MSRRALWIGGIACAILYGFPGFLSFDSVAQLQQSRSGVLGDEHPPAMAELWRICELFIAGPLGMLLVQLTCFGIGTYLLLEKRIATRRAALGALLFLCFPPVLSTMAVIWKDSQMAAWLLLGTGLVISDRRAAKLGGLACLVLGTAMRHNALAMTGPLVFFLFQWTPGQRWWKRYPIAFVAWICVTLGAQTLTRVLADRQGHLWGDSMALLDMTGTLRYAPDLPDAEVRALLPGVPIRPSDLQATARAAPDPQQNIIYQLWDATNHLFGAPTNDAERAAVTRAWKRVVFGYPRGYLTYRWQFFRELIQLTDGPIANPVYCWFNDVQDVYASADRISHDASPSGFQSVSRQAMQWLGDTFLFRPYLYLALALLLLPFCIGQLVPFALLMSGICGELGLFFIAPTPDTRYSFWLVVTTSIATVMLIVERARRRRPPASAA